MTIRRKLLTLLLLVSLLPFGVTFALRQFSASMTRKLVGQRVAASLDQSARTSLSQLFQQFNAILKLERLLMDSLIQRQAREAQLCLRQSAPVVPGSLNQPVLRNMIGVYQEVSALSSAGFQRQCTALPDGSYQIYPEPTDPVEDYDPRQQSWFKKARSTSGAVRAGPSIDPLSGDTMFTIALAVLDERGIFQGVTAIHRALPDLFATMILPEEWSDGAEKMAVILDHNSGAPTPELIVVLHPSYMETKQAEGDIELDRIQLVDSNSCRAMVEDLMAKRSGVRRLDYRGRDALWAYGNPIVAGMVPLVIVPYDRVTELATTLEAIIWADSILWWRIGGVALLLIFVTTSVLGVVKARAMTHPIGTLTSASALLAAGDFGSKIQIDTGDELQTLGEAFNEIGPHLEDRDRMKRSLEVARVIQQDLLPKVTPTLERFEVGARCVYCDQTGGDYYDFIELRDGTSSKVGIALGDVSGHGIGAALLMASVRGIFRNSARHYAGRLDELLAHCNDQLVQDSADDKFVTLFYAVLDDSDRSLIWASGGHDPAIWYRQTTGAFEELPNTGPPLGMFEGMSFSQEGPIHLQPGDILLIGTDGIWEAKAATQALFGKERLVDLVRAHAQRPAQEIADAVVDAVATYIHPHPADDDVTVLVIKGGT